MMAVSLLKEFAGETRAANTCQDQRLGVAPRARGLASCREAQPLAARVGHEGMTRVKLTSPLCRRDEGGRREAGGRTASAGRMHSEDGQCRVQREDLIFVR
jgi:hypothetical protein